MFCGGEWIFSQKHFRGRKGTLFSNCCARRQSHSSVWSRWAHVLIYLARRVSSSVYHILSVSEKTFSTWVTERRNTYSNFLFLFNKSDKMTLPLFVLTCPYLLSLSLSRPFICLLCFFIILLTLSLHLFLIRRSLLSLSLSFISLSRLSRCNSAFQRPRGLRPCRLGEWVDAFRRSYRSRGRVHTLALLSHPHQSLSGWMWVLQAWFDLGLENALNMAALVHIVFLVWVWFRKS